MIISNTSKSFSFARLPQIEFGESQAKKLPAIISSYGKHFLLVTGKGAIENTEFWPWFLQACQTQKLRFTQVRIITEPSPALIDTLVAENRATNFECVVGLGGGSVLDAAKAIAGLLRPGNSVMDHLEGVGPELPYLGPPVPFIAVPTTAGTGSEATKNAVLSVMGKHGFKKSFRDAKLVAAMAILDPELLSSCPRELIAANGMDAFTQLLESYVSINANPITDPLALEGMRQVNRSLLYWYENHAQPELTLSARSAMAYASLMSGITLAQTGLGSVHGLASPLGAFFPIPHGVVCGTLVASATETNIDALRSRAADNVALHKYANVGRILADNFALSDASALETLVKTLFEWTERLALPSLSVYGVTNADFSHIVANSRGSSMKTNPVMLTDSEIQAILEQRLI